MLPIKSWLLIAGLTILSILFLNAQTEAWQRINPKPVESSLNDISLLPNNRIVAVGSGATVIYSDNNGADWEIIYVPDSISRRVEFNRLDFADNSHGMAVGSYYSIIKTDDGGETWTDISPGAEFHYFTFSDVSYSDVSNCFIAGSYWGDPFLMHSSDAGLSWDTVFQTSEWDFSRVQFVDENTGFLSGGDGNYFFKSTDGGANWEQIMVDPGLEGFNAGFLHFIDENTGFYGASVGTETNWDPIIIKTIDGGQSWYQVYTDSFAGAKEFYFIDHDTGYAISSIIWYQNDILKTTDGGETWTIIDDHIGTWSFEGICMNDDGKGIIVGDAGQIYKSVDFGNTWEAAFTNEFLKFTIDRAFITSDSSILANAVIGGGGILSYGVIESNDRGATWNETSSFPDGISAYYSLDDNIAFYGGTPGGIYKSADGGGTWVFHELSDPDFQPLSIDFIDDQIGLVAGFNEDDGSELFKTTDQGDTWMQVISDALHWAEPLCQVEFFNDSTGYIVGDMGYDTSCNILVSYDRGETWEIDTLPYKNDFNGIHFVDDQTGFLYGWKKVCKTINGGQDWFKVTVNTEGYFDAISMSFPSPQTGYLINGSGDFYDLIFKTLDGGDTWNSIASPTTSGINSINFFNDEEGVILGNNSIIFKTFTGGMVDIPEAENHQSVVSSWNCYPNPFSTQTIIRSAIDIQDEIVIRIFDITGRSIMHFSGSSAIAGETFFTWDGRDDKGKKLPSGIYSVSFEYNSCRESMKIIKF
jgi:photosystem II stability/assembly factor-like uncharacterized protein